MNKRAYSSVLVIIAQIVLLSWVQVAAAAGSVVGSMHDLTISGPNLFLGENDQVCIYCHTPHGAVVKDRPFLGDKLPLWNRSLNEGSTFSMYSSPAFNAAGGLTLPADAGGPKPRGATLLCMSCHDGISVLGNVINNGGGTITVTPSRIGDINTSPSINIGTNGGNLSDDHPVSFMYDQDLVTNYDSGLKLPGLKGINLNGGALKLYPPYGNNGGTLECPTCHDPHDDTTNPPFLRMSNAGSAMCLACHIK